MTSSGDCEPADNGLESVLCRLRAEPPAHALAACCGVPRRGPWEVPMDTVKNHAGRLSLVIELSPDARRLLEDVAASARLEGQELPAEDLELARAYLAGEIDAATFQERVRRLVADAQRPAQSA